METLINDILRQGGQRRRLEIKVFGGARMIAGGAAIGYQNAEFVLAYLKAEGMPIVAHHLRGANARRVEYVPGDGRVKMFEMSLERAHVVQSEQNFFAAIHGRENSGAVELFD